MKRFGRELEFISRIDPQGDGVVKVESKESTKYLDNDLFKLNSLSLTNKTWIASGFHTYVVKLKCDVVK